MQENDIMFILLTVGAGCLGVVMAAVQYVVSRKNEKMETGIKYSMKSRRSGGNSGDGAGHGQEGDMETEENHFHRILESYHNQALQQAAVQFWFSIMASALGFALIFMTIFFAENETWYEYILKSFPGAIVEVISALFISQAKETRDRATNLFKELNYDDKIEKSVEIADTIEDFDMKADVKAKIALHIIGMDENREKVEQS